MRKRNLIKIKHALSLVAALLLCALALTGCSSGGGNTGGGGGGTGNATVKGIVLLVSTNATPDPTTTISIGGVSATASAADGSFTLTNALATANSLTIKNVNGGGTTLFERTLPITLVANATTDLGVIYLSDQGYTAAASGRVVTTVSGATQPVANAQIIVSGVKGITNTQGRFTLNNLPVGLGSLPRALLGNVKATGFETKQVFSETLGPPLVTGNNNVPDILISTPVGDTPPPPFTLRGVVTVNGVAQAGTNVTLRVGATTLGSVTTDAAGNYFFWVAPDTFTVTAARTGFTSKQINVTVSRLDTPVTAPTINLTP